MKYKTRIGSTSINKQRVFLVDESYEKDFDYYTKKILQVNDCCIWYQETNYILNDEMIDNIKQMQLAVILVTESLLKNSGAYIRNIISLLRENNIPFLPIVIEKNNITMYESFFGKTQYLSPYEVDKTTKSFEDKLSEYLNSILTPDELTKMVRDAFCAYIFVSYRKKDRAAMLNLLDRLHENDFFRDIAIWYDEFLKPGESFEESIKDAIRNSNLFLIACTENTIDIPNYVLDEEIPFAKSCGCTILPIELDSKYSAQIRAVLGTETYSIEQLTGILIKIFNNSVPMHRDDTPMHLFCIGLAYLNGISVEKNISIGIGLIQKAAEKRFPEAIKKMSDIFKYGQGVTKDLGQALEWQKKLVMIYEQQYVAGGCDKEIYYNLLEALLNSGNLSQEEEYFNRAIEILHNETKQSQTPLIGIFSLIQLYHLGEITFFLATTKEKTEPMTSVELYLSSIEYFRESCWGKHKEYIALCEL